MDSFVRDLHYSLRMMAKAPGFTALVVITLALGIGANTAIFTVANSVLLRPLSYKDPSQLVRISTQRDGSCCVSLPYFTVLADANRSFSGVAAYQYDAANLETTNGPEQVEAERVTGNFFDVLGVHPIAGRGFTSEDDQPGSPPLALIGYELAHRLFASEQNAVGRHLALNSRAYAIIGVLPPKFGVRLLGRQPEIWMTRLIDFSLVTPARVNLGGMYYEALGRLRPGVSVTQARAESDVIFQQYKHDKPANFDSTSDVFITIGDLQANLVSNIRPTLFILSAAVGFVLLIACANVASLLLFRALGRRREFAVRGALGAPRWAMLRQLLIESVLVALISGALGVLIAQIGTELLQKLARTNLPQMGEVPVDWRVLVFTLGISIFSGIIFGLTPALQLSRPDLGGVLSDENRNTGGTRRRNHLRNALVTAQVALSMVLLIGSGLLLRSFVHLRMVDPGFDSAQILTAQTFLPPTSYPQSAQRISFYHDALRQIQSIPGVQSASISTALPVLPTHQAPARSEGQPEVELGKRPVVMIESISPDYPKTLHIALMEGRTFDDSDSATSAPVALVNQTAVRRFWPGEDPIGKLIWIGTLPALRVVGVLRDVKNDSLATPAQPEVFFPFPQFPYPMLYLTLRTSMDPHHAASALRSQIAAVNRTQPITDVQTMQERIESGSTPTRSMMLLIGVFSATAMILALVGIYGMLAFSVAQRTQELGIRMALGASGADILKMVIGNGLRLALAGIFIGLAVSLVLNRLAASLLFQTSATDPLTFIASAFLFAAVATLASYLPARRAMRINPTEALRAG
jgi:putative ABC transport system permease protein